MAFDQPGWFIDGQDHGPEMARLLAYLSTGGNDGVVAPTDLKVTASAIPDGNVHIGSGAAGYQSRFAGAPSEAYLVRNNGDVAKALTPQGGGGVRYDLVCVITNDQNYAGQPDLATIAGQWHKPFVYENVPATTKYIEQVDADQSGYALARVKFDASDGTISPADITDLRQLVNGRRKEEIRIANPIANVNIPAAWGVMPPEATWNIEVPKWATRVILEADWSGLRFVDTSAAAGSASGGLRAVLGALATGASYWAVDAIGAGKPITISGFDGAEIVVPEVMRGTTVALQGQGYRGSLIGMTAQTTAYCSCRVKATFIEAPE